MRYDKEKSVISLSVREAVTTARRGMSGYLTHDEDEPEFSRGERRLGFAEDEKKELKLPFTASGIDFELFGSVARIDGDTVYHTVSAASKKEAKKSEFVKQIRGEIFMLAAMYIESEKLDFDTLKLTLVYFFEDERSCDEVTEEVEVRKIRQFFVKVTEGLCDSARAEIERVTERLPSLEKLPFPYGKARAGQSEFIRSAYTAIARGTRLYATAPTGTGKTVSTLFPAVRALGKEKCDKVFYLTPKQTTAAAAKECLERFSSVGAKIRACILTAKDKLCKRGSVCREAKRLCPTYSSKKYAEATMALFDEGLTVVTPDDFGRIAEQYTVCPYELSLCYSELCDVIVCDFNYLFDPNVYIRRFFSTGGSFAFLIDEAHNLPERAREMYTAELSISDILVTELLGEFSVLRGVSVECAEALRRVLMPLLEGENMRVGKDGVRHSAYHTKNLPSSLYGIFEKLSETAEEELFSTFAARDEERGERAAYLRDYLYRVNKFYKILLRFDECYELLLFLDGDELRIKLLCLDTGPVISERLDLGRAAVIFSGTLSPIDYYKSVLGEDRSASALSVDSPFAEEQLSVSVMDKITTRISEREDSLPAVIRTIAATLSAKRGNYMIFSPSFAYSEALYGAFTKKYPKIRAILQKPNMTKGEKERFLDEFSAEPGGYLAAFCVLGGIYSEGIDLVGDKLIGAVIVGIGMPALSYEREAIAAYYQEKLEAGVEYAYLYPGINRVLQAAGRVIRTEDDRGVIVLIDDRFQDPIYKKSAPKLWRGMEFISDVKLLKERLDDFWSAFC